MVPKQNLATRGFGTTPPARPFFELDGLAGTPPNLGGEFKRSPANSFTRSRARGYTLSPLRGNSWARVLWNSQAAAAWAMLPACGSPSIFQQRSIN